MERLFWDQVEEGKTGGGQNGRDVDLQQVAEYLSMKARAKFFLVISLFKADKGHSLQAEMTLDNLIWTVTV